jgi:hypothetical protein
VRHEVVVVIFFDGVLRGDRVEGVPDDLKELQDLLVFVAPPDKVGVGQLGLLREELIQVLFHHFLNVVYHLELIDFAGGLAHADEHDGQVIKLKVPLLVEVEQLVQELHFLFIKHSGENEDAREYLQSVDKPLVIGVPHVERFDIPTEDLHVLRDADGEILADGAVRAEVLSELGARQVEKLLIDVDLLVPDALQEAPHLD